MTVITLTNGTPVPTEALAQMPPEQRARIEKTMQAHAGKPGTHVAKSCVTKKDLDQDNVLKSGDERHCKNKIISKSASRILYEQTCAAPRSSKATVKVEARLTESMVATMDMMQGGPGGKIHMDIEGRWLGASCSGIED
jgi:hypothetical protein